MATYYDDNFGFWEGMEEGNPDREDNLRFYKQVQKESRLVVCKGCDRKVRLRPGYGYCNTCADKRERGYDI